MIQATDALRTSEQRFRELAEMLPEVIFECDLEGNLTFVNAVAFERFGYTRDQFEAGINASDMMNPEDRSRVGSNITRLLRDGEERSTQYTALRSDGTTFPVTVHSSVVRKDGNPVGLRGILVDITEQIEAQEKLQESEQRYRNIVETSPTGILTVNLKGRIATCNSAFLHMTGYREDELIGKHFSKIPAIHTKTDNNNVT